MNRRNFLGTLAALPPVFLLPGFGTLPDDLVRLAGRCVVGGFYGQSLPNTYRDLLSQNALAGVLVSNGNLPRRQGLDELTRAIRTAAGAHGPVLVAADQEGGPVSHLSPPLVRMPSQATLGGIDDPTLTRRVGAALGAGLAMAGVNFDFAPVLDVRTNRENTVVLGRCFGNEPTRVARHAPALVEALQAHGVFGCAKHFPGHGDTALDSHNVLPRLRHDAARLDAVELVPFRAVLGSIASIMMAHVVYEGLDREHPASLSPALARGLLRERLGYTGVIVTDDLEMAPIRRRYGVAGAAVRAIDAGCDLVLIAHHPDAAMESIRAMAERAQRAPDFRAKLEEAAGRVGRLRDRLRTPVTLPSNREDPAALAREVEQRARSRERRYADPTRAPRG